MDDKKTKDLSITDIEEYIRLLEHELQEERRLRQQEASEYRLLEKEYEAIINEKNQELVKAKGKIISQDITLASYKDKVGTPVVVEGVEHDLFRGEQKDFVLGLLSDAIQRYDKHTRSYKICESLLNANNESGERRRIKEGISTILKSYNGMNKDIVSSLNDVNIKVNVDGRNHYRLVLAGDERYSVNIAHTPSDSRCGLNVISDINKLFF